MRIPHRNLELLSVDRKSSCPKIGKDFETETSTTYRTEKINEEKYYCRRQ